MIKSSVVYLASQSSSRKMLLTEARIPFEIIKQNSDESISDSSLPFETLVSSIALSKMNSVLLPKISYSDHTEITIFVLTADTLTQDSAGVIHGKPIDYEDAKNKIRALRGNSFVCTAFCLDRKVYKNSKWETLDRVNHAVTTQCYFDVPDDLIDSYYFNNSQALCASGGVTIEHFGAQFVKTVSGSYTSILGLPMFEVRQALENLGFFSY